MAYDSFAEAYKAKNPDWNPWTPQQKQGLANEYSALNPTWTPTADAGSVKVNPVKFDPFSDPNFLLGAAGVEQNKTLAQGAFNYGTQTGGPQNFGYTPTLDKDGNFTGNVGLQASTAYGYNPFNQAAELQRSYDISKRGTHNSYAAAGQLYSGAYKNALDPKSGFIAHDYNKSSDALQRAASGYYSNLQTTKDAASGGQYTQAVLDAFNNFLKTQQGS